MFCFWTIPPPGSRPLTFCAPRRPPRPPPLPRYPSRCPPSRPAPGSVPRGGGGVAAAGSASPGPGGLGRRRLRAPRPPPTFAVEACGVVVVQGRELATEHGPRCSRWPPGPPPGQEKRGEAGGAGTRRRGERAGRRPTLRTDGSRRQSRLRNARGRRALTNQRCCWGGGATSGHVDAQINFIVSFLVVQWSASEPGAALLGLNSLSQEAKTETEKQT